MKKKGTTVFLMLILAVLIAPVLIANLYTFPCADDYSDALGFLSRGASWRGLGKFIADIYMTWQGTYFPLMFFPLYHYLGLTGFRWFMLANTLLFIVATIGLINGFVRLLHEEKYVKCNVVLILAIGLFTFLFCSNPLNESLYFYTGAMIYTLPQSLACIAMYCAISLKEAKGKAVWFYTILGACCGILAAGGNTPVVVLLCSALVLGLVIDCINRSVYLGRCIITVVSIAGALINIAAPGWRARYSGHNGESFHLLSGIQSGIINTLRYMCHVLEESWPVLVILFVVVGILVYQDTKRAQRSFRYPVLIWVYTFLSCTAAAMPSVIGFQSAGLPPRGEFVILSMLYLYTCYLSYYTTGWFSHSRYAETLEQKVHFKSHKFVLIFMVGCIALSGVYVMNLGVRNLIWPKMVWHMAKGDYRSHDIRYRYVLEQLSADGESSRMIVAAPLEDDEWVNVQGVGLTEDPNFWANTSIAQYFGLESAELRWVRYDQMENPPKEVN